MSCVVDANLLALTAARLVLTGVLAVWPAAAFFLVSMLCERLIVDYGDGVEVVTLFRQRRVR